MKSRHYIILILTSGGMLLSGFYACTSFIMACISQKPIPVSEAGVILSLAILITFTHHQRGWRRIYVIGFHILGLLFATARLCHAYYGIELPFWRFNWVSGFLTLERPTADWLGLILLPLYVWILWFCGIRLLIKPADPTTVSHRFDLGLACLFFLLLIKLLIAVKSGSLPMEHSSTGSLLSFIILGLFSMGFVRITSVSQSGSATYIKGAGIVLSATVITLILGGGLFILFLPGLQTFAEAGYGLLATLTRPIEQIFIALSRFFFESGIRRKFGEELTGDFLPTINRSGGELGIFHYLFIGITITILLAVAGIIFYRLLKWLFSMAKWLFSDSAKKKDSRGVWERIVLQIYMVKSFLLKLRAIIINIPDTSYTAEKFYKILLRWGRFSGLRHVSSETPREYGIRLISRFPRIEKEIRLIIRVHDEAVYGCIPPGQLQISRTRLALRKIRNPLLWLTRLRALLSHDRMFSGHL